MMLLHGAAWRAWEAEMSSMQWFVFVILPVLVAGGGWLYEWLAEQYER